MTLEFWNRTWSRPYERYNQHHAEIWKAVGPLLCGNIVDLGCGTCVMYKGKQVSLVGIDWSEEALREARKHYPCGVYIRADVRNTGLPSGQFDTVLMLGLLDYFDDWSEVLKEARRLSKGRIIATLLHGYGGRLWTKGSIPIPIKGYTEIDNWRIIEL